MNIAERKNEYVVIRFPISKLLKFLCHFEYAYEQEDTSIIYFYQMKIIKTQNNTLSSEKPIPQFACEKEYIDIFGDYDTCNLYFELK